MISVCILTCTSGQLVVVVVLCGAGSGRHLSLLSEIHFLLACDCMWLSNIDTDNFRNNTT
jgi:hypothetical protein